MTALLDSAAILGKVPWREEYVRLRSKGQTLTTFDGWLTDNIEFAALRGGQRWGDAYRTGGIYAFLFRPPGAAEPLLAGAIGPSSDSAGRNYPLAVVSSLHRSAEVCRMPQALPLVLETFWEQASRMVSDALVSRDLDLERHLSEIPVEAAVEPAEALSAYAEWMRELPLAELWTLVYGESGRSAASITLRIVLEAVRPYQGRGHSDTPLTLRLPLGILGGAAVCFWIDLIRRCVGWTQTIPSFFWSHDGSTGTMLLHLGLPPKSTLAELWMPTTTRDEFCDVTAPVHSEQIRSLRELPGGLDRLLGGSTGTVHELMLALE